MSDYIFTAKEYIERAQLAANERSCYVTGCFGAPLNYPGALERWIAEWPNNQKHEAFIREQAAQAKKDGVPVYGWDCVNLLKGLLWGWDAEPNKEYGGVVYQSNGVPDCTVWDLFNKHCTDRTEDFSEILPGEMLYYGNGSHCGLYIGGGFAIEATGSWGRKIAVSFVSNLLDRYPEYASFDKARTWQAHGKLEYIDYTEEDSDMKIYGDIVCPCCGKALRAGIDVELKPAEDLLATYTVKKGDTPWGIAVKFYGNGYKYKEIMKYNGLPENDYIYEGQVLKIPRL